MIWVIPEWSSGFPYFLQFKSEFGNKEFMVWATVSSLSCFCWLYRASPSLAAKNIINLILVLTIWWCLKAAPVGRGCLLWPVHFLGKTLLVFALLIKWNNPVTKGQILHHSSNMRYLKLSNSYRSRMLVTKGWGKGQRRTVVY